MPNQPKKTQRYTKALGHRVRRHQHENRLVLLAPNQVENEFLVGVMGSYCMQGGTLATSIIHSVSVANPWTSETPDTELSFLASWPEQNQMP